MKKSIEIAVSKPCHENWSSFTKTAKGGFCSSCQKEVVDFTSWSDERVKSYFKNLPASTCGRFRAQQLKVYEYDNGVTTRLPWIAPFFAGALLIFSSRQVAAQPTLSKHPIEQYEVERKLGEVSSNGFSAVKVKGVVKSQDDGNGIPGVNVALKGTSEGTTTDVDGNFRLNVQDASSSTVLVFSFLGFETVEHAVDDTKGEQLMEVRMKPEVMQLGGIVVGGAAAYRWYSPKRWWWKVRRVFVRR